jgi:undecaprenyl-diphosphatase
VGYLDAVLLGIVQGLTEFLPVSSSAHLILARLILGWDADQFGLAFDVACHVGTLLAVLVYFRHDLWDMTRAVPDVFRVSDSEPAKLVRLVAIGTVPVVIVGLLWASAIESRMRTPAVAATTLALGALGFFLVERFGSRTRGEASLGYGEAVWVGCAQAAALVPGVSRSGATMTLAMAFGLRRDAAARFSFLLGIPAIVAAAAHAGLDLLKTGLHGSEVSLFVVGLVTSAVVGYVAIGILLRYLTRHSLSAFAWYRLAVALAVVLGMLAGRG